MKQNVHRSHLAGRVPPPAVSVFLVEVSSGVFPQLQDKYQENVGPINPGISLAIHNHQKSILTGANNLKC